MFAGLFSKNLHRMVKGQTYTLREIHMDTVIINQDAFHLEVGLLAVLLVFKLNKSILQAIPRFLVPNHLAGKYGAKPAEYQVEILIYWE